MLGEGCETCQVVLYHFNLAEVVGVFCLSRTFRLNGDVVWATSTQRVSNSIRVLDGPATATLEIPKLGLLEGTYYLSASISNSTSTTEFDHCQNWLRFNVHKTNMFDEGIVSVESSWSLARQHR